MKIVMRTMVVTMMLAAAGFAHGIRFEGPGEPAPFPPITPAMSLSSHFAQSYQFEGPGEPAPFPPIAGV